MAFSLPWSISRPRVQNNSQQSLFKLSFCDCISFNELFTPCSKQLLANFRSSTQRVVFPSPRWKWKLLLTLGLECLRGEWWGIQSESFCRLTEFAASKLSESGRLPCLLCLFYLSVDTQINVRNTNQSSLPLASSVKVALLVRLSICSMSRNIMWSTKNWFDTSRSTTELEIWIWTGKAQSQHKPHKEKDTLDHNFD